MGPAQRLPLLTQVPCIGTCPSSLAACWPPPPPPRCKAASLQGSFRGAKWREQSLPDLPNHCNWFWKPQAGPFSAAGHGQPQAAPASFLHGLDKPPGGRGAWVASLGSRLSQNGSERSHTGRVSCSPLKHADAPDPAPPEPRQMDRSMRLHRREPSLFSRLLPRGLPLLTGGSLQTLRCEHTEDTVPSWNCQVPYGGQGKCITEERPPMLTVWWTETTSDPGSCRRGAPAPACLRT